MYICFHLFIFSQLAKTDIRGLQVQVLISINHSNCSLRRSSAFVGVDRHGVWRQFSEHDFLDDIILLRLHFLFHFRSDECVCHSGVDGPHRPCNFCVADGW